jgi:hypothetical protein
LAIDPKLERAQFRKLMKEAREATVRGFEPLSNTPGLIKRQIQYAKLIKERGIPAAQLPPPFIVKRPQMSQQSKRTIRRNDIVKRYHDGTYEMNAAFGGEAWSCCGNGDRYSAGCKKRMSNPLHTLYD